MLRVRDMPDHVHILIRKHKHLAEQMMEKLKEASRWRLIESGHRAANHPTWTAGTGWKVHLETPDDIRRTIRYIERNPLPLGLPVQRWPFVRQYDGWPLLKCAGASRAGAGTVAEPQALIRAAWKFHDAWVRLAV